MMLSAPEGVDPVDVSLEERVDVVRMQSFSLDTRSDQTQDWPIAVGIDATSWASAVLVVIVHRIGAWESDTRLQIVVDPIDLDPDDPKQIFLGPTVGSVVLSASSKPETCHAANLAAPWGKYLRVALRPEQRTIEATAEQTCTLTVLLIGRRQGLPGEPRVLLQRAQNR
jgi:hypothetical protein